MDSEKPPQNKPSMDRLATRPLERNFALTKLGLGAGTQIVAHSLRNVFRGKLERSEADHQFVVAQAQVLADELGRLKGSVMKAGQMLSLYGQYFLPEEAVQVLSHLQDDTQPVSWKVIAPVLEKQLGAKRLAELEIDEYPLAAASLGQAHRARRRSDGRELVVKVQYPGVADAIESDVKTLSRLLSMTRLAPKGLVLRPSFDELREMLYKEVDYVSEREFTEDFARRLAEDPRFVVPKVFPEYSSARVLTTSFEEGLSPRRPEVLALSQARRNRLGVAFIELFLEEFFEWRQVQTDPHFGNYRVRIGEKGEQDRIVLLDFGATRNFAESFVQQYGEVVRGAILRDKVRLLRGAVGIGLMHADFPAAEKDAFAEMCEMIVEPFNDPADPATPAGLLNARGEYRWAESNLPMRVANVGARNAISRHFRVPPREIAFLHRRIGGVFVMLSTLAAEVNVRARVLSTLGIAARQK